MGPLKQNLTIAWIPDVKRRRIYRWPFIKSNHHLLEWVHTYPFQANIFPPYLFEELSTSPILKD